MKPLLIAGAILASVCRLSAQHVTDSLTLNAATDSLKNRIVALEKDVAESKQKINQLRDNVPLEKYEKSLLSIELGLMSGTEIESLVPSTIQLLAVSDLVNVVADLNSPTSPILGSTFVDVAIESASNSLLPKYASKAETDTARAKFKSLLKAIYTGPLVQGVLNSNPISSTINGIIQQAGLFQIDKTSIKITKRQFKDKKDANIPIQLTNTSGPNFGAEEIRQFYSQIADRVNFYKELNEKTLKNDVVIRKLTVDAEVFEKSMKSSRVEICKLLKISSPDSSNVLLREQYGKKSLAEKIELLRENSNFVKAVRLSELGVEQLPELKLFNKQVSSAMSNYVDDYISVLNKYALIDGSKLDHEAVKRQIDRLKAIKDRLAAYPRL
ncbi:hypothetical protein [Sphingobacterium griseoflavum]|uniref:Uncharacterized protein n=1 Tax=Sphingobacterium griseoflavum TaxID=1474952 RepID=A0ABQ3HXY1_9SPHI|nr:hypothetical protein [Sphingobacterium griseoflavum]GHE31255.1 hypothetical protein GCM10017764_12950 [Sphingobacterium griseoflavum]